MKFLELLSDYEPEQEEIPDFMVFVKEKASLIISVKKSCFSNILDTSPTNSLVDGKIVTIPKWDKDLRNLISFSGKLQFSSPQIQFSHIEHQIIHMHQYLLRMSEKATFQNIGLGMRNNGYIFNGFLILRNAFNSPNRKCALKIQSVIPGVQLRKYGTIP